MNLSGFSRYTNRRMNHPLFRNTWQHETNQCEKKREKRSVMDGKNISVFHRTFRPTTEKMIDSHTDCRKLISDFHLFYLPSPVRHGWHMAKRTVSCLLRYYRFFSVMNFLGLISLKNHFVLVRQWILSSFWSQQPVVVAASLSLARCLYLTLS